MSPPTSDQDTISNDADVQRHKEDLETSFEQLIIEPACNDDMENGNLKQQFQEESPEEIISDDDDGGEWITPKNLIQRKQLDAFGCVSSSKAPKEVTVACITNDFAMQVFQQHLSVYFLMSFDLEHFTSIETVSFIC